MLTIRRALEAKKAARENGEEAGFSLIELIIVVVILGILVAIAIPIFLNIQQQARDNAAQAVAATGATQAAAQIAQNATVDLSNLVTGDATSVTETGATIDAICVTVVFTGVSPNKTAGPGCP